MKTHELLVEAPSTDEIDVFFAALHRKFKDEEMIELIQQVIDHTIKEDNEGE